MILALIIFLAVFVQSSIGFGLGLIAMPLLVALVGIATAAPTVAVVAILTEIVILLRYREAISLGVVSQLTVAALLGIPLGIYAVRTLDSNLVTTALGIFVISYAIYALLAPRLPDLAGRAWSYVVGFVAGILGGAYNTAGPPVIVYGNCREWPPDEFKSNLQGFFLVNSIVVASVHGLSGNFTPSVWNSLLLSLPGIALGLVAGFLAAKHINPILFRKLVLVFLIVLGFGLIIG
jgi:uncharacterized membrane protein YfcA